MTKKHRRHSTSKKREVVEAYFNGASMRALSQKHDICRTLIPIWIDKYERGEFDDDAIEEELLPEYTTRIAALERLVGRQVLEIEFLRTARAWARSQRSAPTSVITGPTGSRSDEGVS